MSDARKLTRSISLSHTNLNCFGHFDGIHKLILGKFRFGMALTRSKSVCDDTLMLNQEDDVYLPVQAVSDNNLAVALDFSQQQLRRAVSQGDLVMAASLTKEESEEKNPVAPGLEKGMTTPAVASEKVNAPLSGH